MNLKSGAVSALAMLAVGAAPPVKVELTHRPTVDRSERTELRYELRVANRSPQAVMVNDLSVRDERGRALASLSGPALQAASDRAENGGPLSILPGAAVTVFLEVDVAGRSPPHRLRHVVGMRGAVTAASARVSSLDGVDRDEPVTLGPPLRGGPWVAVHSPAWPRGHRRVFYTEADRTRLPGRYAIDFVGVAANGATSRGDPDRPADAVGYGSVVVAVADAVVAGVRDGIAESPGIAANSAHAGVAAAGNHVVLALGRGRYAFYEHLKPGSIAVRVGQRVRRGAVIGALGFTGDSTGPHMHFHVADAPSPLGGEGLPFVIDRYRQCGRYPDIGALGQAPWAAEKPLEMRGRRPGSNVVVVFGETAACAQSSGTIPAKSAA